MINQCIKLCVLLLGVLMFRHAQKVYREERKASARHIRRWTQSVALAAAIASITEYALQNGLMFPLLNLIYDAMSNGFIMSKVFRSPKYLTLLGAVVLSLLLIVTYVSVRAQQNADREIEIQLEKAAAPTDLADVSLPDYIALRNNALREKAATSPERKTTAMIFFSDNKAPDALRTFLAESQIPLRAIKGLYNGWGESVGGFDVTEKHLQDLEIQNTDDLVAVSVKIHRAQMSFIIERMEETLVRLENVEFKKPEDKEMALRATREALQQHQAYDASIAQHGTQFYSLRVEYELGRLVEIQNRPDVALVDIYLEEGVVGRISPFAIKDAKEGK